MFSHYHVLPRCGEGGVSRYMHAIYIEPPLFSFFIWLLKRCCSRSLLINAKQHGGRAECAQDVMSVTTLSKILQLFCLCRLDP